MQRGNGADSQAASSPSRRRQIVRWHNRVSRLDHRPRRPRGRRIPGLLKGGARCLSGWGSCRIPPNDRPFLPQGVFADAGHTRRGRVQPVGWIWDELTRLPDDFFWFSRSRGWIRVGRLEPWLNALGLRFLRGLHNRFGNRLFARRGDRHSVYHRRLLFRADRKGLNGFLRRGVAFLQVLKDSLQDGACSLEGQTSHSAGRKVQDKSL
jgi:hypothetical protein